MKESLKLEIKLKLVEFEESLKQQVKNESDYDKRDGLITTQIKFIRLKDKIYNILQGEDTT